MPSPPVGKLTPSHSSCSGRHAGEVSGACAGAGHTIDRNPKSTTGYAYSDDVTGIDVLACAHKSTGTTSWAWPPGPSSRPQDLTERSTTRVSRTARPG